MKKLLVLSGKGGTGKTTVAASFAFLSKARAVADCDVDAPNLHLVSQLDVRPVVSDFMGSKKAVIDGSACVGCQECLSHCRFGSIDVVDGKCVVDAFSCEGCGVCEFVCPVGAVSMVDDVAGQQCLYVSDCVFSSATLKMGRGNSGKLVSAVKQLLYENSDAELAIIDGSPGIGCPVIASMSGVDLVLIVAEPSVSGLNDLKRLVNTARSIRVNVVVCVNKYDVSVENFEQIVEYCRCENVPFVGQIPYDSRALEAMNEGLSLVQLDSLASRAIRDIFDRTLVFLDK